MHVSSAGCDNGNIRIKYQMEQDHLQRFFTIGLALRLEPLPKLSYDLVKRNQENNDARDAFDIGQGQRLKPRISTFPPTTFDHVKEFLSDSRLCECVRTWSEIFSILDAADDDPHFSKLRHFFDARLSTLMDLYRQDDGFEEEPDDITPTRLERKSSVKSSSRAPKRLQWPRRASASTADQSLHPARSIFGSVRKPSSSHKPNEFEESFSDKFDLWLDDHEPRRVRFGVRLDLDRVCLANSRNQASDMNSKKPFHVSDARLKFTEGLDPEHEEPSIRSDDNAGSITSRRSFVQRMFEKGLRRESQNSSNPPTLLQNHEDMTNASNQAFDDSDEEQEASPFGSPGCSTTRHGSVPSNASRPQLNGASKAAELERVEEKSAVDLNEKLIRGVHYLGLNDAQPVSYFKEGQDFISLLRKASVQMQTLPWSYGQQDPLSTIITYAFADAFGWEGILHLCYGKHSACEREQIFSALGRAADMELHRKEKYDAVLSWRDKVWSNSNKETLCEDETPQTLPSFNSESDQIKSSQEPQKDEIILDPLSKDSDASCYKSSHDKWRTWEDWRLLFTSLSAWVSEYETTRVQSCLSHEYNLENVFQTRPCETCPNVLPLSVEKDAISSQFGFWRLSGIPSALRLESNQEHMDYRWARVRLESSMIGTPLVMTTAGVQFFLMQLTSAPWVYHGAWELDYLDKCIFESTITRERFPPPGDSVVTPLSPSYSKRENRVECPYPSVRGAWSPDEWKKWLGGLREGHIITPTISWQGWWTLIAVLNGADHSGRPFDLQLRAPGDPVQPDEDGSIYL